MFVHISSKMAAEKPGNRFLLYVLLGSTGVLAYFYWNAASSGSALFVELEQLTLHWTKTNRTLSTLRSQLDNCKAQVPMAVSRNTESDTPAPV